MRKRGMTVKEHQEFAEKLNKMIHDLMDWDIYLSREYSKAICKNISGAGNKLCKLKSEMEDRACAEHPEVPLKELGYYK